MPSRSGIGPYANATSSGAVWPISASSSGAGRARPLQIGGREADVDLGATAEPTALERTDLGGENAGRGEVGNPCANLRLGDQAEHGRQPDDQQRGRRGRGFRDVVHR